MCLFLRQTKPEPEGVQFGYLLNDLVTDGCTSLPTVWPEYLRGRTVFRNERLPINLIKLLLQRTLYITHGNLKPYFNTNCDDY